MPSRKPNNIRQLQDGRWQARLWINGKRESFVARTQAGVLRDLHAAQRKKDDGRRLVKDRSQTVATWLDSWLEEMKTRARASTFRGYEAKVRTHIRPALGRVKLTELGADDVERWLRDMVTAGSSPRTANHCRAILRAALNDAIRKERLERNAAALASPRKLQRFQAPSLSIDEARRLLEAISGDRLEALYSVAMAIGLRQGEALGLHWADVDLKQRTIRVRCALQRLKGEFMLVEPKSETSRRSIALPDVAVLALQGHWDRQQFEKKEAGYVDQDLVFCTELGTPIYGTNLTKTFQRLLVSHGLPRLRFHDLRHTCASLLLAQGVHPRMVMEVLGHSNISLTLNTYSHVIQEVQRVAADQMDALFAKPVGDQNGDQRASFGPAELSG